MHIADYSQSATLEDIDEKWVADFITHLTAKRGLLNGSVDKTLRILKSALYWAQGRGYMRRLTDASLTYASRVSTATEPRYISRGRS